MKHLRRGAPTRRVTFHIYEHVYNSIKAYADRNGVSMGYAVNLALDEFGFARTPDPVPSTQPEHAPDDDWHAVIDELYGPPDTPDTSDT